MDETVETVAADAGGARRPAGDPRRPTGRRRCCSTAARGAGSRCGAFGVVPDAQGHGVAAALVDAAVDAAPGAAGCRGCVLAARVSCRRRSAFWEQHGLPRDRPPGRRTLDAAPRMPPVRATRRDADATRELGRRLAAALRRRRPRHPHRRPRCRARRRFTQGLGEGLGVRGDVTSPTFVIARVHPSAGRRARAGARRRLPARAAIAELDDLDLDASLDDAVTVVEWGEGLAEALAEDRLEVRSCARSAAGGRRRGRRTHRRRCVRSAHAGRLGRLRLSA